jgi:hypothetical protein
LKPRGTEPPQQYDENDCYEHVIRKSHTPGHQARLCKVLPCGQIETTGKGHKQIASEIARSVPSDIHHFIGCRHSSGHASEKDQHHYIDDWHLGHIHTPFRERVLRQLLNSPEEKPLPGLTVPPG